MARINQRELEEQTDPEFTFRYVDIATVGRGRLVDEPRQMLFGKAPSRARRLVRKGDTLVSTVRTYLRATWTVDQPADDLVASTGFAVVSPTDEVDSRFLSWWLQSDDFIEDVVARSVGVSYPAISPTEIGRLGAPLASRSEQRAIADFLDRETARIDALMAKKRDLSLRADARWRAALVTTMGLGQVASDSSEPWLPQQVPASWELKPLRRLIGHIWGGDWGNEPGEDVQDLPCVRAADFDFANLSAWTGASRSYRSHSIPSRSLQPGDMVIEKSGGGEGVPVGRVVAWRGEGTAMPTNFAGGLRSADTANADYVLLALRAAYEIGLPWRSIKQTTGLQNLDLNHYLTHPWPLPPINHQRNIAIELLHELRTLRRLQQHISVQIERLLEHRQALVTAAVTGQLEVPSAA